MATADKEGAGILTLEGIRGLEAGHIVAGGGTTALILADLCADVIKAERPDGCDQARNKSGGDYCGRRLLRRGITAVPAVAVPLYESA